MRKDVKDIFSARSSAGALLGQRASGAARGCLSTERMSLTSLGLKQNRANESQATMKERKKPTSDEQACRH